MAASEKEREEIFYEALEIQDPDQRAAYLEEACGADPDLRARVEALLKAHERAGDFLKTPAVAGETVEGSALEGPGSVIGHYELLELTGEGGMGLVYLAEQKEPVRRRVAFKIIKPGMDSRQVIGRFEAERQALAVLDHPNIAHVFDAGTTDTGRPYFVMEYVRGMSITRYCDDHKLTVEQRLRLFEQVCEAVQHAHQKGIIHRDLKPSNILVSVHGDRAVPKIIDFGIAKAITQPLTDKTFATLQGHLLGTPEYMSPEQVDLATQDIDTRSDIYSLGVVLYELLAGVLPFETEAFERAGLAEIQQTIREMEPTSPSLKLTGLGEEAHVIAARRGTQVIPLARRLHRELEWIPLKAMRKDRCRRYRSASEMADDVRNYLAGLPLLAGPETTTYRVRKFVRKHAGSVMTVALVATAIVLGLVVSIWQATVATKAKDEALRAEAEKDRQAQIALDERDKALVAQRRAEASEEKAQDLLYAANMNLAQHAWEQNNVGRLRKLLEETATFPHRGFEWYYWQRQAHLELRTFRELDDSIWSVAFSPDGRRIVTGSIYLAGDLGDLASARVWEVDSGKELISFQGCYIGSVAFSPDGRCVGTGDYDGTAKVWEVDSGKQVLRLKVPWPVYSVAFSPDGRKIATGCDNGTAKVWEISSGKELLTLQGHTVPVPSVTFSPDGQRILTASYDGTAKGWEANTGKELFTLEGHGLPILSAAFSPDGQRIVTGAMDQIIKVWDANSAKELLSFRGHNSGVASVAFSPDGQRILTGSLDQTAKLWEATSGKELLTLKGHSGPIFAVAFSPDGRQVLTGSHDLTAKLWDVADGKEPLTLEGHNACVRSAVFSPEGRRIVTGSEDQTAKVWHTADGEELFSLTEHSGKVKSVAFSPDGQRFATGSEDGTAKVWEAAGGKELLALKGHSSQVLSVAFSADGQRIVTGSYDRTAKVWEAASGKELLTLKSHGGPIQSVAFSPDGARIITGSQDQTAKVWETASGKELFTLQGHGQEAVWSVAFSPDGRRIATGGYDCTAKLWESKTGKELLALEGHSDPVRAVAFSPDSRRVLTGSNDRTAKVWDAASGRELLTLKGHGGGIMSVAFSRDGQRVLTGSYDATARVWQAASSEHVAAWQEEEKAAARQLAALRQEQVAATERRKTRCRQDPGAIKQWLVLAPLAFDGRDEAAALQALDQRQIPQEATLRPQAGDRVQIGEVERSWEVVQLEDNVIDFHQLLGGPINYSLAYAVCYIDSEVEQADLVMKVGTGWPHGDPVKVYLNEREIYRQEWSIRGVGWNAVEVTGVELRAGVNVLVFKIVNRLNDWLGSIWLTDAASQPVEGIHVTLEPPEEVQP